MRLRHAEKAGLGRPAYAINLCAFIAVLLAGCDQRGSGGELDQIPENDSWLVTGEKRNAAIRRASLETISNLPEWMRAYGQYGPVQVGNLRRAAELVSGTTDGPPIAVFGCYYALPHGAWLVVETYDKQRIRSKLELLVSNADNPDIYSVVIDLALTERDIEEFVPIGVKIRLCEWDEFVASFEGRLTKDNSVNDVILIPTGVDVSVAGCVRRFQGAASNYVSIDRAIEFEEAAAALESP